MFISDKILKKNLQVLKVKFVKDRPGHDLRYSINSKKLILVGILSCNFDESLKNY